MDIEKVEILVSLSANKVIYGKGTVLEINEETPRFPAGIEEELRSQASAGVETTIRVLRRKGDTPEPVKVKPTPEQIQLATLKANQDAAAAEAAATIKDVAKAAGVEPVEVAAILKVLDPPVEEEPEPEAIPEVKVIPDETNEETPEDTLKKDSEPKKKKPSGIKPITKKPVVNKIKR